MRLRYEFHPTDPIVVHESGACYLQVTWIDEDTGTVVLIDHVQAPYAPFYQGEDLERYVHAVLVERAKQLVAQQKDVPPAVQEMKQRLANRRFRVDPARGRVVEVVETEVPRATAPRDPSARQAS